MQVDQKNALRLIQLALKQSSSSGVDLNAATAAEAKGSAQVDKIIASIKGGMTESERLNYEQRVKSREEEGRFDNSIASNGQSEDKLAAAASAPSFHRYPWDGDTTLNNS